MGLRTIIAEKIRKSKMSKLDVELQRIREYEAQKFGYANVFDKPFKFNDGLSFVVTYQEIFINQLYNFKPRQGKDIILDCGANMGLSVLYLSLNYPSHQIYAFEPDNQVFEILCENVSTFNLKNVKLFNKAVWDKKETLKFYTDGGLGGRVLSAYESQEPTSVDAVRLVDYLSEKVDFLKLDIEGAEGVVLRDCASKLQEVGSIFFEYHNDITRPQNLHELLDIVKNAGFHYYLKESSVRLNPFNDTFLICEKFDMALNIFCYK